MKIGNRTVNPRANTSITVNRFITNAVAEGRILAAIIMTLVQESSRSLSGLVMSYRCYHRGNKLNNNCVSPAHARLETQAHYVSVRGLHQLGDKCDCDLRCLTNLDTTNAELEL